MLQLEDRLAAVEGQLQGLLARQAQEGPQSDPGPASTPPKADLNKNESVNNDKIKSAGQSSL